MKKLFLTVLLSLSALTSFAAWPTKDITIIVPYTPGSFSDQHARVLQSEFNAMYKVNTNIRYIPGAAGGIALQQVLSTDNDNHTFIWVNDDWITPQVANNKHLYEHFSPLTIWGTFPVYLFGGPNLTPEKFREQVQKGIPLNVGNIGINGHQYLWLTNLKSPVQFNMISYKGLSQQMVDILGGTLDYGTSNLTTLHDMVNEGKIHPIMISTHTRSSLYKDVPTAKELGFEGESVTGSLGFIARKDTDPEAFQAMSDVIRKIISRNEVFQNFGKKGVNIVNLNPAESRKYADKVIAHTKKLKFAKE